VGLKQGDCVRAIDAAELAKSNQGGIETGVIRLMYSLQYGAKSNQGGIETRTCAFHLAKM